MRYRRGVGGRRPFGLVRTQTRCSDRDRTAAARCCHRTEQAVLMRGRRHGGLRPHALTALCVALLAVAVPIPARAQFPLAFIGNLVVILVGNNNLSPLEGRWSAP